MKIITVSALLALKIRKPLEEKGAWGAAVYEVTKSRT